MSRVHIAVTKLHTQPGIKEKFISDMKNAVSEVMKSDDKHLGKTVRVGLFKVYLSEDYF